VAGKEAKTHTPSERTLFNVVLFSLTLALLSGIYYAVGVPSPTPDPDLDKLRTLKRRHRVRARHILIKDNADFAEKLASDLRQDRTQFAALARKHSTDKGSGARGGELNWFDRKSMVKPFTAAVFNDDAEMGQILGPVESRFGHHIIQVTGIEFAGEAQKLWPDFEAELKAEDLRAIEEKKQPKATPKKATPKKATPKKAPAPEKKTGAVAPTPEKSAPPADKTEKTAP
jgi:hypothetical protein